MKANLNPRPCGGSLTAQASGGRGHRQKGVAAMEFALVFPFVFLLVYGLISYGLILLAQQTMTLAVGEGARAGLRYASTSSSAGAVACSAVTQATSWLGTSLSCTSTSAACPYSASQSCLTVSASFPYQSKPLVPTLPGFGLVLPTTLSASATVELEPVLVTQ